MFLFFRNNDEPCAEDINSASNLKSDIKELLELEKTLDLNISVSTSYLYYIYCRLSVEADKVCHDSFALAVFPPCFYFTRT